MKEYSFLYHKVFLNAIERWLVIESIESIKKMMSKFDYHTIAEFNRKPIEWLAFDWIRLIRLPIDVRLHSIDTLWNTQTCGDGVETSTICT